MGSYDRVDMLFLALPSLHTKMVGPNLLFSRLQPAKCKDVLWRIESYLRELRSMHQRRRRFVCLSVLWWWYCKDHGFIEISPFFFAVLTPIVVVQLGSWQLWLFGSIVIEYWVLTIDYWVRWLLCQCLGVDSLNVRMIFALMSEAVTVTVTVSRSSAHSTVIVLLS